MCLCVINFLRPSIVLHLCNILIHPNFPVHIRGVHKWSTHLCMPMGCTGHNLACIARGCTGIRQEFTFARLGWWNIAHVKNVAPGRINWVFFKGLLTISYMTFVFIFQDGPYSVFWCIKKNVLLEKPKEQKDEGDKACEELERLIFNDQKLVSAENLQLCFVFQFVFFSRIQCIYTKFDRCIKQMSKVECRL